MEQLGEGSYGCVIHPPPPPIRCRDLPWKNPRKVRFSQRAAKVFRSTNDREVELARYLADHPTHDQAMDMLILPEKICEISRKSIPLGICERTLHGQEDGGEGGGVFMTVMPLVRTTLTVLPLRSSLETVLSSLHSTLAPIQYLQDRKVVHFDLKSNNVLVLPESVKSRTMLIDFGLSFIVRKGKAYDKHQYWIHPPEGFRDPSRYMERMRSVRAWLPDELARLGVTQAAVDARPVPVPQVSMAVDVWSWGIMALTLLNHFGGVNLIPEHMKTRTVWREALRHALDLDPNRRWSPGRISRFITKSIPNNDAYRSLRKSMASVTV